MPTFRSLASASIVTTLALAVTCSASLAGSAADSIPVVTLTARLSPKGRRPGTPVALTLDTHFASDPPGGSFVLRRLDYVLPRGTVVNGRLFPSCSVRRLRRARGALRACPKGSKIGSGTVVGRAVEIDTVSRARVTLFNGPGGRSVTISVRVKTPAIVTANVSARLRRLASRGADELSFAAPAVLRKILDGDIVTSRVTLKLGAASSVNGVKRGYIEVGRCPRSGKVPMVGHFTFDGGSRATAGAKVAC